MVDGRGNGGGGRAGRGRPAQNRPAPWGGRGECLADAPLVAYHGRSSGQIETLDKRLEKVAGWLFMATLIVSVATIALYVLAPSLVDALGSWFTLVSAGFPALGTAVFG